MVVVNNKPIDEIIVFGGGRGLLSVIESLKLLSKSNQDKITAVVATGDDGGSSGRIISNYPMLIPPGDIRRAFYGLSTNKNKGISFTLEDRISSTIPHNIIETTLKNILNIAYDSRYNEMKAIKENAALKELLDYEFKLTNGLDGHNVGNLIISAAMLKKLDDLKNKKYNDLGKAIDSAIDKLNSIYNVRGKIFPTTSIPHYLKASYEDRSIIIGQHKIDTNKNLKKIVKIELISKIVGENVLIHPSLLKQLNEKNNKLIIISQGSLWTSIAASLIPVSEYIKNEEIIYLVNNLNSTETPDYGVDDYIKDVSKILGRTPDRVIYQSTKLKTNNNIIKDYSINKGWPEEFNYKVPSAPKEFKSISIKADMYSSNNPFNSDPAKLCNIFKNLGIRLRG